MFIIQILFLRLKGEYRPCWETLGSVCYGFSVCFCSIDDHNFSLDTAIWQKNGAAVLKHSSIPFP